MKSIKLLLIIKGKMEQITECGLPVEGCADYTLIPASKVRLFSSI